MTRPLLLLPSSSTWLLLLLLAAAAPSLTDAQRFLRDGFTSAMDEEFKYETEDAGSGVGGAAGMSREMVVLQQLSRNLQVSPPASVDLPKESDNAAALTKHLGKYLNRGPLTLQLEQRKGGKGYRAFGVTPDGTKRLRGSWRRATPTATYRNDDFLRVSYDEAVRSRSVVLELELMLPKLQGKVPRVVYTWAVEGGVLNPKAIVPRADTLVQVYADRRDATPVGTLGPAKVGWRLPPGIVDPNWARGKSLVRPGRTTGLI